MVVRWVPEPMASRGLGKERISQNSLRRSRRHSDSLLRYVGGPEWRAISRQKQAVSAPHFLGWTQSVLPPASRSQCESGLVSLPLLPPSGVLRAQWGVKCPDTPRIKESEWGQKKQGWRIPHFSPRALHQHQEGQWEAKTPPRLSWPCAPVPLLPARVSTAQGTESPLPHGMNEMKPVGRQRGQLAIFFPSSSPWWQQVPAESFYSQPLATKQQSALHSLPQVSGHPARNWAYTFIQRQQAGESWCPNCTRTKGKLNTYPSHL